MGIISNLQGGNTSVPGGALITKVADSLQGLITSQAAYNAETSKAIKEIRTQGNMVARFGDRDVGNAIQNSIAPPTGTPGDPVMPPPPTGEDRIPYIGPTTERLQEIAYRRQREFKGPDVIPPATDFSGGYTAVRREGIAGLRQRVRQGMARRVSQASLGGDDFDDIRVIRTPDGELMEVDDDYELGEGESDYRTMYQNARTGEVLMGANALRRAQGSAGQRKASNAIRQIAGSMGRGASLESSVTNLSSSAGQALGTTAAVVTAAKYALDTAREQRAANLPYQQATGGSSFGAFGPRGQAMVLDLESYLFGGNPNADKIYQQAFGILPGDRGLPMETVDMANRLYRSIGYNNDAELIRLVDTAVESGLEGINKIADSLINVSRAAEDAGLNAQEAQARWTSTFQSLAGLVGGEGAVSTASVLSEGLTGLGPLGENVSIDTSEAGIRRIAALNNMTYNDALAILSDPSRAQEAVALFNNPVNGNIQSVFTPTGWQTVQATIGTPMSEGEVRALAQDLLANGGITDLAMVEQILGFYGIQASGQDAIVQAILIARGDFGRPQVEAAERQVSEAIPSASTDTSGVDIDDRTRLATYAREGVALDLPFGRQAHFGNWDMVVPGGQMAANAITGALGIGGPSSQETAYQKYQAAVERTGYRNPIIEDLLTDYDKDQSYVVQTADGPVAVRMFELLDSFYEQALAYGVEFVGGSNSGTTFAEYQGVTEQAAMEALSPDMRGALDRSVGQTYTGRSYDLEELQEEARREAVAGGTDTPTAEIRINAGPELERLINIESTGTDDRLVVTGTDAGNVSWWQRATGGG